MGSLRLRQLPAAVVLTGSFASVILVGTFLLCLPQAQEGEPISVIDGLFTSASAVCVTGLTVVDTGSRFSAFGETVIVVLIQVGGLGLMTFAVFVALLLGRSVSFQDRLVVQDALHHSPTAELKKLVRYILGWTFLVEGIGALILFLRWRTDLPPARAAWMAVFHSVSAFCNAGFSLLRDSLVGYRGDVTVCLTIAGLIVVGGLGFIVNMELRDQVVLRLRRQRRTPLSLHAKLVLATTVVLLAGGTVAFYALEQGNLLRDLAFGERMLASGFQAVTPRTAGFNTVDFGQATAATLLVTMLLMFVGGSPGSTAGGIKTTSFALVVVLLFARWRGRGRAAAFRRTIPHTVMDRALTLTIISVALVFVGVLGLVLVDQGERPFALAARPTLALAFEAVSAFGTVGLSTGLTPQLGTGGKLLLIGLMFVGRVGPLTVALAAGRSSGKGRFRYAEENVMIG